MKRWFVAMSLMFIVQDIVAQRERYRGDSLLIAEMPGKQIDFPSQYLKTGQLPLAFRQLFCYDSRLDTTCIGVTEFSIKKRLLLSTPLPASIVQYLENSFETRERGTGALHIYMKKFRLFLFDSLPKFVQEKSKPYYRFTAEAECYYEQDVQFFPAFRIDTSYAVRKSETEETGDAFSPFTQLLAGKCESLNVEKISKRKKYSSTEITNRYARGLIIKEHPARGLYRTIEELKTNTPFIVSFEAKYKGDNFHFSTRNDSIIHNKDILFYSDGSRLWICNEGEFCPLIRLGNRYEFCSWKKVSQGRNNHGDFIDPNGSLQYTSTKLATALLMEKLISEARSYRRIYRSFDIETGEVYH